MWKLIAVAAIVCAAILFIYILRMKRQLRNISAELDRTAENSYNRLLTVSLFDKDINRLAISINNEIDNRKKMKLRIEQTEKSMKQAIADIAHDLRTPLSVIKGELQIVSSDYDTRSELRDYVDICIDKADELKTMTDGFFELVLLESDSEKADLKRINLTNLLMNFIAENEGLIRMHDIEPEIVFPGTTVYAMGDEQMIKRLMGNLLGNVIKYSSGSFTLELTPDSVIKISNPAKDTENIDTDRIFDRSYRADGSRKSGSAGLGLYIVKLLCEKISASAKAETDENSLTISIKLKKTDD